MPGGGKPSFSQAMVVFQNRNYRFLWFSSLFSFTGMQMQQIARALLAVAQAARLLGAESLLVGVSAEVAQTIVTLGVDLGAISVYPNLQEAVGGLLAAPRARAS